MVDRRNDPALVLPATAVGALIGLIFGWLLGAGVTCRLARQRPAIRGAAEPLFLIAALMCAPAVASTGLMAGHFLTLEPNAGRQRTLPNSTEHLT